MIQLWNQVNKKIKKAVDGVMVALFGRISSVIKDNGTVFVESSENEEVRDIIISSPYGFYSLPLPDTMGQVIFNNSFKKGTLIGVVDDEGRPVEIDIGEVLIYRPGGTSYIHLKNDDIIYIKGDIKLNGTITNVGG